MNEHKPLELVATNLQKGWRTQLQEISESQRGDEKFLILILADNSMLSTWEVIQSEDVINKIIRLPLKLPWKLWRISGDVDYEELQKLVEEIRKEYEADWKTKTR